MSTQRFLLTTLLLLALMGSGASKSLDLQGALPADIMSPSPTSSAAVFDNGHPWSSGAEVFPWQPSQPVYTFSQSCGYQSCSGADLAVDAAGVQYAVWYDDVRGSTYFAYKSAGSPWSANERIPVHGGARSIGVDAAGRVYIARISQGDVVFTWRSPGGVWSPDERVNEVTGTAVGSVSIGVDPAGKVSVVWIDQRNDRLDVFFNQRQIDGVWSGDEQVNDDETATPRSNSKIAIDGNGNVYIVWDMSPEAIMFALRAANGLWNPNERIASSHPGGGSGSVGGARIAVSPTGDATVLFVSSTERGNPDVYSLYRPAGGSWSDEQFPSSHCSFAVALAVDSAGNAYALVTRYQCYYPERGEHPHLYQRAPGGEWTRVSQPSMSTSYLIAAHPAGSIYIVTSLSGDLYSIQRDPAGIWSRRARISDLVCSHVDSAPAIAADAAGNSYAVWQDGTNADHGIFFAQRPAGGSWSDAVRISDSIAGADQRSPQIAASPAGHLVVVWEDTRNDRSEIYSSQRPPGGSWSANQRASAPASYGSWLDPGIAVDSSGRACALWKTDYRWPVSYFASCLPAGGVWEPAQEIGSSDNAELGGAASRIAMDASGGAYAVWPSDDGRHLIFAYRPWGGTWGTVERIDDGSGRIGGICCNDLAVDGAGNAYAVWRDNRNSPSQAPRDPYFAYRPAGGPWSANSLITSESDAGKFRLAADAPGNAYLIWDDSGDIFSAYRPAGGVWSAAIQVEDEPAPRQYWVAIAVDGSGNAYAIWMDARNPTLQVRSAFAHHDDLAGAATPVRRYLPLILRQ